MRRVFLTMLAALMIAWLASCASGSGYRGEATTLPPLSPDLSRVFVYRLADVTGAWTQPIILMNGTAIGKAVPGGYHFRDVVPGSYLIETTTEPGNGAGITVGPGAVAYVRLNNVFDGTFRIIPEAVGVREGQIDLQGLSFVGA